MLAQILIAVLIVFGMLAGWIFVQHLARAFAARHPEFGPAREEGEGCGALLCLCKNQESCPKLLLKKQTHSQNPTPESPFKQTGDPR